MNDFGVKIPRRLDLRLLIKDLQVLGSFYKARQGLSFLLKKGDYLALIFILLTFEEKSFLFLLPLLGYCQNWADAFGFDFERFREGRFRLMSKLLYRLTLQTLPLTWLAAILLYALWMGPRFTLNSQFGLVCLLSLLATTRGFLLSLASFEKASGVVHLSSFILISVYLSRQTESLGWIVLAYAASCFYLGAWWIHHLRRQGKHDSGTAKLYKIYSRLSEDSKGEKPSYGLLLIYCAGPRDRKTLSLRLRHIERTLSEQYCRDDFVLTRLSRRRILALVSLHEGEEECADLARSMQLASSGGLTRIETFLGKEAYERFCHLLKIHPDNKNTLLASLSVSQLEQQFLTLLESKGLILDLENGQSEGSPLLLKRRPKWPVDFSTKLSQQKESSLCYLTLWKAGKIWKIFCFAKVDLEKLLPWRPVFEARARYSYFE